MEEKRGDSIFWIEVEKISPNPYQPRKEFNESKLTALADSIRQYGILQPLVVVRNESQKEDGGLRVGYELIAGERRLRASKIAGLSQVPVVIRSGEESNQMKLELAIIENLQREDLNAIDRARAFQQLATEFKFKHNEIAKKVGKSREYVSNTLRLLLLPPNLQEALSEGEISEGHARPLLMLNDRFPEQQTLFKEITAKKLTVREAEAIARRIATDKVRKKIRAYDPEIVNLEQQLTESLGTRVQIESREVGGKIVIDFFSNDDLRNLLETLNSEAENIGTPKIFEETGGDEEEERTGIEQVSESDKSMVLEEEKADEVEEENVEEGDSGSSFADFLPWRKKEESVSEEKAEEEKENATEEKDEEDDIYSIKNFSV
jgi:ParB family chromosome partitioning protein